ncbi:midnolin-like [Vanacampus margaritifer]
MRLIVGCSSIGGPLELVVPKGETVDGLRTRLARQLNVHKDRIVLLHKDRQLTAGQLAEHGVADGSRLTLQVPVGVKSGLLCSSARTEKMVEVLERLTESEMSDFLSGRSPLAIQLGMGAHTMHVQLQLSAQDVAKLQLDTSSGAVGSPPPKVNVGQPASSCSPTGTSPASSPPLVCSGVSVQSDPRPVSSMDCPRRVTSRHSRPHVTLLTPSFHAACPLPATTAVCFNDSVAAPASPIPASTFREAFGSSAVEPIKQPGAVIESFVRHSQGVFSGTFSGTLAPCSRSGVSRRGRGIAIILQILDDLLGAASHHQGAPPASLCPASDTPAQEPGRKQRAESVSDALAEEASQFHTNSQENQTLHCKLKHLQSLMDQRRHHRQTRRSSQFSQAAHPYRRHHRP